MSKVIDESNVDEILKQLEILNKAKIHIGIIGDSGKYEDDITVLDVANFHEYGTSKAPERSFIRATYDTNKNEIIDKVEDLIEKVVALEVPAKTVLDTIGEWGVSITQEYIRDMKKPPLNPKTIAAKGSSALLVDTGQLRNSITYKVVI